MLLNTLKCILLAVENFFILINKKNKQPILFILFLYKKNPWQLPIFAYTIVGVEWLNFCVRDGNRCTSLAIVTKERIIYSK